MSHNTHEQLQSTRSSGQRSGASGEAPKRWATAAALLTLALGQVAQAVDGQLDSSFGDNGQVIFDVNNQRLGDRLFGVAILPDGRIVVGGSTGGTTNPNVSDTNLNFVVAAFSGVNGSLDTGFGIDGLTITEISGMDDVANALLVLQNDQGESKIVLVGRKGGTRLEEPLQFAAVRYRANGQPDTGFDDDGIVETFVDTLTSLPNNRNFPMSTRQSMANDVAVQRDGKIILAGVVGSNLFRFELEPRPGELRPNVDGPGDFAIVRYNPNGSLDDGGPLDSNPADRFGDDGRVATVFEDINSNPIIFAPANAVVVQPDGKIIAGGEVDPQDRTGDIRAGDFVLVRYNQDGSLDDGGPLDSNPADRFGDDGTVRTDFGGGRDDSVADLVLQPEDGKIVAGGSSTRGGASQFALARYNVNGSLDTDFGTGGTKTTDFPDGSGSRIAALVRQPGGKLVAAGSTTGGDPNRGPGDFALVRYQPNGREDTTFGDDVFPEINVPEPVPDGIKITPFGEGAIRAAARGQDVALGADGKIVVAGFFTIDASQSLTNPSLNDFALARYQSSVIPENVTCQGLSATVIGTPGNDILVGTRGNDVIHGLGGNDTIIAQSGDDIVCGGPGDDFVFGGPGADTIEGGDGSDRLVGDQPDAGVEGPDTLRGGEGDDSLFGFGGNDLLEGDAGNDTLVGDDLFAGTVGPDVLRGGEGDDRLFGAGGNDQLFGDGGVDELVGGPGDDMLNGGPGNDRVFGEGGADILAGDAGNDTLVGDTLPSDVAAGPDVLRGGEGDDDLFGGDGIDQLLGNGGRDELDGGPGNDELDGGLGDDPKLFGGDGDDTILGGSGRFKDRLVGGAGQDELRGGPGNDSLFGGPGRDRLFGGAGSDRMDGEGGLDSGIGGSGRPDRCFRMGLRVACEIIDVGRRPTPPSPIQEPPPAGSPPGPTVCNFPGQCGA